jgi:hypothetical protein
MRESLWHAKPSQCACDDASPRCQAHTRAYVDCPRRSANGNLKRTLANAVDSIQYSRTFAESGRPRRRKRRLAKQLRPKKTASDRRQLLPPPPPRMEPRTRKLAWMLLSPQHPIPVREPSNCLPSAIRPPGMRDHPRPACSSRCPSTATPVTRQHHHTASQASRCTTHTTAANLRVINLGSVYYELPRHQPRN